MVRSKCPQDPKLFNLSEDRCQSDSDMNSQIGKRGSFVTQEPSPQSFHCDSHLSSSSCSGKGRLNFFARLGERKRYEESCTVSKADAPAPRRYATATRSLKRQACDIDHGSSWESEPENQSEHSFRRTDSNADSNAEEDRTSLYSTSSSLECPDADAALRKQVLSLQQQNRVLRNMVQNKDNRLTEVTKTLKLYKTKLARQEKTLQRMSSVIKTQHTKKLTGEDFNISRVRSDKVLQQQANRLGTGRVESFLSHQEKIDCAEGGNGDSEPDQLQCGKGSSQLTPHGNAALAIRRNLSNISAEDLGLVIMDDASKQTVLRAECRTAAALIANARLFFQDWKDDEAVALTGPHVQAHSAKTAKSSFFSCNTDRMVPIHPSTGKRWLPWSSEHLMVLPPLKQIWRLFRTQISEQFDDWQTSCQCTQVMALKRLG